MDLLDLSRLLPLSSRRDNRNVALDVKEFPRGLVLGRSRDEHHRHFRRGMIKSQLVSPQRKVVTFRKHVAAEARVAENRRAMC